MKYLKHWQQKGINTGMKSHFILIEGCNFVDFPIGGQLSFARQMMKAFGNRLALVGISTDETPVGQWVKKEIDGVEYDYFAVGHRTPSVKKPVIPGRLTGYLQIRKCKKQIMSLGVKAAFIQAPQILIAVHKWGWESLCYCFPGVSNPLERPRYKWGKIFARIYEKKLFSALNYTDIILASADTKAIDELVKRSCGKLLRDQVVQFQTRVDTDVFRPMNKAAIRSELGINADENVIVSCGRLNLVKGWDFLLDAFEKFILVKPNAKLIFVGDGEDRSKLEQKIKILGHKSSVKVTGFVNAEMVVKYINASDLYVVGSHKEGWSVAMLEALACGKPIVTTDVSGASDMIMEGQNGYVVEKRDPVEFAKAMEAALMLQNSQQVSLNIAENYALKNLSNALGRLWKPLS